MEIVNREETIKFLNGTFLSKQNAKYKRGVSTVEIMSHLGRDIVHSGPYYVEKVKQLFAEHEIPFTLKGGLGWIPENAAVQQSLNFSDQTEPAIEPDDDYEEIVLIEEPSAVSEEKLLFGKTKSEIEEFLEQTTKEKESAGLTTTATKAELLAWLNVSTSPKVNQQIKDFFADTKISWYPKHGTGFVRASSSGGLQKEELDEAVNEMEKSLNVLQMPTQHGDVRLHATLEILRQHSDFCLMALEFIWAK